MVEVGQLVLKIAGRDSGEIGIIVEVVDDTYVVIDGNVRKKKCNLKHLETLKQKVKIKKGASSETIKKELEKLGIAPRKTGKKRTPGDRPRKKRKVKAPKEKEIKKEKPKKKEEKKEVKDKPKTKPKEK
jgi:large subunit ribosomal protein L14e